MGCDPGKEDDDNDDDGPIMCLTGQLCVPPLTVENEEGGEPSIFPGVCEDVPSAGVDPCPFSVRSKSVQCLCEAPNADDSDANATDDDDDAEGKNEGKTK